MHVKESHQQVGLHVQPPLSCPFLVITDAKCQPYTAVHRLRPVLSCCCCSYLEQSAPTSAPSVSVFRIVWRLFSSGVHFLDTYRNLCSACAVTLSFFGHFNRSFLLSFTLITDCCVQNWQCILMIDIVCWLVFSSIRTCNHRCRNYVFLSPEKCNKYFFYDMHTNISSFPLIFIFTPFPK